MAMSNYIPIVIPVAIISAIGGGLFVSQTPDLTKDVAAVELPSAETNAAVAALAAVTAAAQTPPVAAPSNTSQQLAALLETPQAAPLVEPVAIVEDVDVTRTQGFATADVSPAIDAAAPTSDASSEPIGADFFNAAQARILETAPCVGDVRNMAQDARVYFPSGALSGDAAGIAQARIIGIVASGCDGIMIEVQGHSDPSGDPAINLQLSQQRAETVITRLKASGIDTSNFVAVGLGSARPSGVRGPQPDAYYDRRVEFAIIERPQTAAFTAPAFGTNQFASAACVQELQDAANATTIAFSPGSVTASREDLNAAFGLAQLAADCPQARLRVVGQHAEEYGTVEDPSTGRMRAVVLMTAIVGAGYPSEQIIIASPSDSKPIEGQSNSRIDFDIILEEL